MGPLTAKWTDLAAEDRMQRLTGKGQGDEGGGPVQPGVLCSSEAAASSCELVAPGHQGPKACSSGAKVSWYARLSNGGNRCLDDFAGEAVG